MRILRPYNKNPTKPKRSYKVKEYDTKEWKDYSWETRCLNNVCNITGKEFHPKNLVVDHIIPVNEGGSFWDKRNHQVINKWDHSRKTLRERNGCKTKFIFNEKGEKIPA